MWIRAFAVLFELRERVILSLNDPSILSPHSEKNKKLK
jgi:hypothetical protein